MSDTMEHELRLKLCDPSRRMSSTPRTNPCGGGPECHRGQLPEYRGMVQWGGGHCSGRRSFAELTRLVRQAG